MERKHNTLGMRIRLSGKPCFPWIRRWIVAVLLAGSLLPAHAAAIGQVVLPDSVKPVEQAPPAGPVNPHKALVTRNALEAAESAAPLEFEVVLKMRNFSELKARVARGERVSLKEMAARYEPSASDYEAVAAWIASQGLNITRRDGRHMAIFARGTVSQVRQTLQVTFARVALDGREYTSAITAPSVPAALSPLLLGINGLQPHIRAHKHLIFRQDHPDASSGGASYFPKQIAQAYNATALYNNNITGSGESIAIVIDTFPAVSDLEMFWQAAGVSQSIGNIQFIQAVAGVLPNPSGEETLDTEWSSSIAPGARVRVYAATDLANADLDQAYEVVYEDATSHPELAIHQMSMSYGQGETYTTLSQVQTDDQYFVKLAAAGVTCLAAAGDDGSTPGANEDESGTLQVETPASDPNVVGVGGTTLVLDSSNKETSEVVWNENGGASGGGLSEYFLRPSWQTGTGVVSGTNREVPDVASGADPDYGAVIVLGGVQETIGGTSWSVQTWSGFCALINQALANAGMNSLGVLGPHIYPLLDSSNYPTNYLADFRDITSGNNATRNSGGKYDATPGYDLCTGVGVPLLQTLTEQVAGSSTLVGVQMPAAVQEVAPGRTATFTVAVSGGSATYQWQRMPIGSSTWVNLSDGGAYTGSATATLTIAGATTAMSGDQFQCLVNLGSNTVTTAPTSVLIVDTPLGISTLAGQAGTTGRANGTGSVAEFNYPSGVAVDGSGNLYIADYGNNQIREIAPGGAVSTPYGSLTGRAGSTNGAGNTALFRTPNAVAIDGSNNLYVADTGNNIIRKIAGGTVSTLAGTSSQFSSPAGIAVDGSGNVYVADTGNDTIREITPAGSVNILAGQTGVAGYADGDATTVALFNSPTGVAVDGSGNVYVADFNNSVVRKISSGTVTTIAGQAEESGYLDGLGANALFNAPIGLGLDTAGNLYIADALVPNVGSTAAGNNVLRKLTPAGVVSTLAGQLGVTGSADGTGDAAQFYSLQAVVATGSGQVYVADTYNQTIRMGGVSFTSIISLSGTLAFGDVMVSDTATGNLAITNIGNAPLSVTGIAYPAGFSGNWASGVIASGSSQNVTVSFAPTSPASYDGNIVVSSNATSGSPSIAVSGAGVAAPSAPTVTTSPATDLNASSATLNGSVNPEGSATTVYFQYGLTTGTGYTSMTASMSAGVGTETVPFSAPISDLKPQTVYYYQAVASNATATVYGANESFTTPAFVTVPVVATATANAAADVPGAEFSALGNPAINSADYVAFEGTLATGIGGVTTSDNSGIWAENGFGTLNLVARRGSLAPGAGGAVFSALTNPVYNDSEAVAFLGTLQATSATGIWSTGSGSLALVARQGSPAPGFPTGATFKTFNAFALADPGNVLLLATSTANHKGIWVGNSPASLQLIVSEGGSYNGKTITGLTFLPALSYVSGQTRSFAQVTGDLAYRATFSDKTTGIFVVSGTTVQPVVQSQGSAAGVAGAQFSTLGNPALNANDDVAFEAKLATGPGGVTASSNAGIWAGYNTITPKLVAQTGGTAPGAGATFRTLSDPVYNDNGAVAFRGTLSVAAGQATSATDAGVWSNSSGSLALVAQKGGQAPGCPAGATFRSFTSLALPNQGGVILLATLNIDRAARVTSANDTGIWAVDTTGNLQLIVRKGDVRNGQIISSLSFLPILSHVGGQSRNFTQGTGDLVYEATFSDKTSAIFEVIFP